MFETLFTFAFGSPKSIFLARVLATLTQIAPCASHDATCESLHRRVAIAVTEVSWSDKDPVDAASRLLGACRHETRCGVEHQHHGPAVTVYQLEGSRADRAAWLADDVLAATVALGRARTCGGSFRAYATGKCNGGGKRGAKKAAELRASTAHARRVLEGR